MKKTLVIGASVKPERYSNMAIKRLLDHGHPVQGLAPRDGEAHGVTFTTEKEPFKDINTVTMYVGQARQPEYEDYIISLKPKRVIFNPGTENPMFAARLAENGIASEESCTLVLLNLGAY